ncbi:MAG: hypothetical protein E6G59_10620, partial [Actinobacteria bacterium]
MRRIVYALIAVALTAGGVAGATPGAKAWHGLLAGVGVADATWHVGSGAGQYASGALPIALVKDDNYLAQDMLSRRAAQILQQDGSKVTYDHILLSASHDHNSPYYSTPAWGVWLFQDVMDIRFFEYQARAMAHAIEAAERSMRAARVGATTVQFRDFQGNIAGADVNEDGSPTGYPLMDNDHGVVVMRFDDITNPKSPQPLATWVNYAEHGESLDGYDLISGDWLAPFERFVYPAGHVPRALDQGDVVNKIYGHMGYAQAERGTHLMAEQVVKAWQAIGGARNGIDVQVPSDYNPQVGMLTHWVPG